MIAFEVLGRDPQSGARLGRLRTSHGEFETPVFMPVGTQATVKTLSQEELEEIGFPIILGNTYHLYLRPGAERIARLGGLHSFMNWNGSILTDSGGFQVFSLANLRRLTDEGARFRSHIDGSEHLLTPEASIAIQTHLGSDIMMAFDECPPYPAERDAVIQAVERTYRWAVRSKAAWQREDQSLFGIVQGGVYEDLRRISAEQLTRLDLPGYAIGGVSVGEPPEEMYRVAAYTAPLLPDDKPRYLMGVGTPEDIRHAVRCGVDMFDCVLPTRLGRHGAVYTSQGRLNLRNSRYAEDPKPIDPQCSCKVCHRYSAAYIHHLFKAGEPLAQRLASYHNLWFYHEWMRSIREKIRVASGISD